MNEIYKVLVEIRAHYPVRRAKYFYVYRYPEDIGWTACLTDWPTPSQAIAQAKKRFPTADKLGQLTISNEV